MWNSSPWNTVVWNDTGAAPPPPPPSSLTVTSAAFNVIAAPVPGEDPLPAMSHPANTASEVQVRILNRGRRRVADVTNYESVEWVRNLWGENKFSLVVPNLIQGVWNEAARHLREHNFIFILFKADVNDPSSVFEPEFLGVIEYIRRYVDATGKDVTEVRGESILKRRVIVPPDSPFELDDVTGTFETVLRGRVNNAFGPGAPSDRRGDLIFLDADQGRGGTIHFTARYDNLLDKMGEYARAENIGFELTPGNNLPLPSIFLYGFLLKFIPGVDRSTLQTVRTQVIFSSDMKDIESQEVEISSLGRPNTAYMGGTGSGGSRLVARIANTPFINPELANDPIDYAAIRFDGAQEIVIPSATGSMKGLVTGTIEGWVYPETHTTFSSLYYESVAGGTNSRFNLFLDSTGHLVLWIRPSDGTQSVFTSTDTVATGKWSWVAAQFDFNTDQVKLHIFTIPIGPTPIDTFSFPGFSAMVNTTPQEILLGNSLIGRMARWRLWSPVLSEASLQVAREQVFAPGNLGTVLHDWRMDEGEGLWVTDYKQTAHGHLHPGGEWVSGPSLVFSYNSGIHLKEVFWDASDVTDFGGLRAPALAKFRELGSKITVQVEILATGPYRYRHHYDLGDLVTWRSLEWEMEAHLKITELVLRAAPGQTPSIKMSIGGTAFQYPAIVNREIKQVNTLLRR